MGVWDWLITPKCPVCGRSVQAGERCFCRDCRVQLLQQRFQPWQDPHQLIPLYTWGSYDGALRRALQVLKYDRQRQVGIQLGEWLGQAWIQAQGASCTVATSSKPVVIPIPLYADKLKQRGYNQAALLSEGFCRVTGYPHHPQALQRIRATAAQFGLSADQRQQNIRGAFQIAPQHGIRSPVLLVDDIYTTGSTVAEATYILRQNRILVAGILVIARPPLVGFTAN